MIRQRPAGQGLAWRGDWRARLGSRLSTLGYESLTSFASLRPLDTFSDLVNVLGPGDFAPVQLHWVLIDEAEQAGRTLSCAVDMLVRFLRAVPGGWPAGQSRAQRFPALRELTAWQVSLPDLLQEQADILILSLMQDSLIPPGWKPNGASDQILREYTLQWDK